MVFPRIARLLFPAALAACLAAPVAAQVVKVPPGNRSEAQPPVSGSSIARTAETKGTFDGKYQAIYNQLAAQKGLMAKIVKTAAIYDVAPIHIIGAIIGEHTYNVDAFDNLQSYYVKAISYLNTGGLRFAYQGEGIEDFVARPEFAGCDERKDDYGVWTCRDLVWRNVFRGKTVDGKSFPASRFEQVFFQPFYAGQTFGLGQLSPLTALSVSDVVEKKGGLPPLDMRRAPEVYNAVMDPDRTLHYMAAILAKDIQLYRDIAGVDISGNPGITATLYNVGQANERAAALAAVNKQRRAAGQSLQMPQENYYGWLVNDRLEELQKLLP